MTTDRAPHIDVETGAFKREHFLDELARAVGRCSRDEAPLCLVLIDVDELQEANDLHGRESVDAQLARFAEVIGDALDGLGPLGRLEPGRFAAFFEGAPIGTALDVAQRIRRGLKAQPEPKLLGSLGVAEARPGEPWGNLLEAAESACTKAKQQGRDAVVAR